jgi:uncharacterized protein (TIGR02391 family)
VPTRRFTSSELEAICRVLGEATVGGRIPGALADAGIPAESVLSTKWRRLLEDARREQARSGDGSCVLRLIEAIMAPVGFSQNPEAFDEARGVLNRVLALTGHELEADGLVAKVEAARTLKEAERRAVALHEKLADRGVHPDVLRACRPELLEDNYFHAVLEATKSLAEKVRSRTGLDGDGYELFDKAFSLKTGRPPLAFNRLENETEKGEHRGLATLMMGVSGAFRNPTAHAPRESWPISEKDATDLLQTVSLLHRRLDEADVTQAAPAYGREGV